MPNVIKMPMRAPARDCQEPPVLPNYTGHFLCLNPEKVHTFQCGGFILGPRRLSAIVPEEAQMPQIHRAIEEGILLDITKSGEIRTENSTLQSAVETDTRKKVYLTEHQGELVAFGTEDPEEQERLDAQVKTGKLELPPGHGDEDKYLLKFPGPDAKPAPASRKAFLTPAEETVIEQYRKLKPRGLWGRIRAWLDRWIL
jgi:hypothetical protein